MMLSDGQVEPLTIGECGVRRAWITLLPHAPYVLFSPHFALRTEYVSLMYHSRHPWRRMRSVECGECGVPIRTASARSAHVLSAFALRTE